jgi:formiminotetrahydrofolate cyclodeaminase
LPCELTKRRASAAAKHGEIGVIDQTATIERFLEASGARQPTPGGGSVTALAGALAAAMGEMAVNYSIGKNEQAAGNKLAEAAGQFRRARAMLLELMVEDQSAYEALAATRKLASDAPQRTAALRECIAVPQGVAAAGVAILDLCDNIVESTNPRLLSDLAICAELAMATVRCAVYNVRVNLADLSEAAGRGQLEASADQLLSRGILLIQRVVPRIWRRAGTGA